MPPQGFHRCRHCRGFYEAELPRCKWCNYDTVFTDSGGKPVFYADRERARVIQVAEYEQLPAKTRDDPMGPPPENLFILCACIHCGEKGHDFEAIEMRWIANEGMWACPCTTCGGRGFQFDIHPTGRIWQCSECKHWYTPEKFTSKYAKCPICGSEFANGWYDDEDEDGEPVSEGDGPGDSFEDKDEDEEEDEAFDPAAFMEEILKDIRLPGDDDGASAEPPWMQAQENEDGREHTQDDIDFPRPGIPEHGDDDEGDDSDVPF